MKNRLLFLGALLMLILFNSCNTPKYLSETQTIGTNIYGSYIKVSPYHNKTIKGELIAVDNKYIAVLTKSKKATRIITIPKDRIKNFHLSYARPKNYAWSLFVFPITTLSHGFFLVFTAPVNIITTTIVTIGGNTSFQYTKKNISYNELKMFARFPQGIPPNIEVSEIK